jgi:hypothetical protein
VGYSKIPQIVIYKLFNSLDLNFKIFTVHSHSSDVNGFFTVHSHSSDVNEVDINGMKVCIYRLPPVHHLR